MIVGAAFLPHGVQIIPGIEKPYNESFKPLHKAMMKIKETVEHLMPQTIFLLTPHGIATDQHFGLYVNEQLKGKLIFGDLISDKEYSFTNDIEMAKNLHRYLKEREFPITRIQIGVPSTAGLLNWGELVPLYYLAHEMEIQPHIIVVSTPLQRYESVTEMVPVLTMLGQHIIDFFTTIEKKVFIGVSGDLAHTHDANGPYGYHQTSKTFDELIVSWLKDETKEFPLKKALELDTTALSCGLAPLIFLSTVQKQLKMKKEFLTYGAPTYFGMACAFFLPQGNQS